ncbi:MAG: hypothetical protein SVY53_05330 [Chloroflexota bacterium]|nr:hypothetical protein [Chloroflexota bacterium]
MAIGEFTLIDSSTPISTICEDPKIVHVSGTTYAIAYTGPDQDGWLTTVSISDDGETMSKLDDLEIDASYGTTTNICHVSGDIFAIAYLGPSSQGYVITHSIASDGTIGAQIDSYTFGSTMNDMQIFKVSGTVFGLVHTGSWNSGFIKTLTIDNDGTITFIESYQFNANYCNGMSVVQITPTIFAISYNGDNNTSATVRTIGIEADGNITGSIDYTTFSLGAAASTDTRIEHAVGNIYAVACNFTDYKYMYTVSIDISGNVSAAIDNISFDDRYFFDLVKIIPGVMGISYNTGFPSYDRKFCSYPIDILGNIGDEIDSITYDTSTGGGDISKSIHVFEEVYAIVYNYDETDGKIVTIDITNTIGQGLPSNTPAVHVYVHGDSYDTTEITYVESDEMMYGSRWIIRLDNSDQGLNSKSYVGRELYVTFGFSGEGEITQQRLTVYKQRFVSLEGVLMLELECMDAWGLLAVTNPGLGEFWNYPDQASGEVNEDTDHYDKTIIYIMSTVVQNAIGKAILLNDDDGVINTYSPAIRIVNDRSSIRQLVEMTETYLYWGADGNFHVIKPDDHGVVYTYNDDNSFWVAVDEDTLVIPNRVRFYGTDSSGSVISADADDSTSQSALGYVVPRYYYYGVQEITILDTTAKCQALANATLSKIQDEIATGYVEAPIHCSQKLYDKITITDTRSGKTTTGYIHRIQRTYDSSAENNNDIYKIAIFLGGQMTGFTPDSGAPSMPMIERVPVESSQTARPHIENMGFTESAELIDQDIDDNDSVSANVTLDRNKLYTAYVRGSNMTDTVEQWGLTIAGTSSDGNVVYSKTHGPHDQSTTYTALTFFTGTLSGGTSPAITISIFNGTGGTRHFHGKVFYSQIG